MLHAVQVLANAVKTLAFLYCDLDQRHMSKTHTRLAAGVPTVYGMHSMPYPRGETDLSTSRCFQGSLLNPTVTACMSRSTGCRMIANGAKTSVTIT